MKIGASVIFSLRTVYAHSRKLLLAEKLRAEFAARGFPDRDGVPLSPGEAVNRLAYIALPCGDNRLFPLGLVQSIGVELGFQGNAAVFAVMNAALAGLVQIIAGVELNAGAVGIDGHTAAGFRVRQGGAGVAEDLKIVVVAPLQVQGLVVSVQVPGDGLGNPEIHGRVCYRALFSGWDVLRIVGAEVPGGHGQNLMDSLFGMLLTGQIEIAVVGHIEDGLPVAAAFIADVQASLSVQTVGHPDMGSAREALVAVGAFQGKRDGILLQICQGPQPHIVGVGAGVEVVLSLVGGQNTDFSVQREAGAGNSVGIAAYGGPQKAIIVHIGLGIVIAQNHVLNRAGGIRDPQLHQGGTQVCDFGGETAVLDGIQAGFLAAVQIAEFFFHENAPFYFLPGTVGIMLRPYNFIVLYSFRNYNAFFWPDGQFGNIPVGIAFWGHPVDFRIIPRQKRNHNI